MKKFVFKSFFFLIPSLFISKSTMAQYLIKGKVLDAVTKDELIGATAVLDGTTIGTTVDLDGNFELDIPNQGNVKIVFRNVGYGELKKDIKVAGSNTNIGTILLSETSVGLEDVTVIASVVRSDRMTPVAVSNIKLDVIEEKMGNQEFPEILKQTPSVYATKQGGGFGDSRINMRGFDSNNIGVLVNGVPVNDMENGKVYWSNWAGLSDVTQFMQVQRGLGASKLGLSSAGGTINIITKSTESKKGAIFSAGVGNDGMNKVSLALSTGLMDNGWAFTALFARTSGDGYVHGTEFEGYSYFLNVSKMFNERHRLSLTAFGAPQGHNQRGVMLSEEGWENAPGKDKYNPTVGRYNGKLFGGPYGYNEYHKPQFSLNHTWTINDNSSLNTAAYASIGTGGGRRVRGDNANWLQWNSRTGQPYVGTNADTKLTEDGLLDYDAVIAANREAGNSQAVLTSAVNNHNWFGVLSSYNNRLTENVSITLGYDGRYYMGDHYEEVTDLLGGNAYVEKFPMYPREKGTPIMVGDKTNFWNKGEVVQQGVFGQAEYTNDQFSSFISSSLTYMSYRYHALDKAPLDGRQVSEAQKFLPWSTKAGFNWKFNPNHNAFVNGGFFTRTPYFTNVFKNYTIVPFEEKPYEKIYTVEGGYTFSLSNFTATVNGYYTEWHDRGKTQNVTFKNEEGKNVTGRGVLRGLNQRHTGVEIETTYLPTDNIELRGMFSYGDWIYTDNVTTSFFDDNQNYMGDQVANVKGVHVGNSAQMTAALGASWQIVKGLKLGADFNFFGKNFADFDATERKLDELYDSWQIPNYCTVDMNASYRFTLKNKMTMSFFSGVNNLLNKRYIADAKDATINGERSAIFYYGFGTTWSAGMKVTF